MLFFRLLILIGVLSVSYGVQASEPMVDAAQLREWLHYLSSDEMKGRANGSPEIKKAAHWLVEQYKENGLKAVPGQKGFLQPAQVKPRGSETPVDIENVIGYLEGSDPVLKNEYILLSGHYDHVGTNPDLEGDTIFNGADDDGSGVILTLGIVRSLHKMKQQPGFSGLKRSLLVVAWAGEELGLRGSKSYLEKPFLPVNNMMVNLNFEMVGHTEKLGKKQVWQVGHKFSNLYATIKDEFTPFGWTLKEDAFPKMGLFFRSDNATFALLEMNREAKTAVGIPAHSFSTWGGEGHYHQVNDEPDTIDYENLAELTQAMTAVVLKLANQEDRIAWIENEFVQFSRPDEKEGE